MKPKKKAVVKTSENNESVEKFIKSVADEQKRKDSAIILQMMRDATKKEPKMWGSSLIGFGNVTITSPSSGRTVDWFIIGFSPRKANLSLYLSAKLLKQADTLKKLGKCKTGMGCLYLSKLEDVDLKVLKQMINDTVKGK